MKRQKYKCKNINEFKRFRTCTHPHCQEQGIVSYRNDGDKHIKIEYRCIPHVGWVKEPPQVKEAKTNVYVKMIDVTPWLDLTNYHAGFGR